jgi:putative tryptophan/tyrosine transport system substrate-binding protein
MIEQSKIQNRNAGGQGNQMRIRLQLLQRYVVVPLTLVGGLISLALSGPTFAAAAQTGKIFKIGIITDAMVPWHTSTNGFRDGLKEFGYVEGKNVLFETRAAQGDLTHLPKLTAELLEQKPDLLFCVSDACSRENRQIPMVFTQVSDPVRLGLVQSIPRPGGNVTGIANLRAELTAKRLELFKETVPPLRRILLTYDPSKTEERDALASARSEASRLKLNLIESSITDPLEIEPGLAKLREGGQDGILVVQSGPNLNIAGRSLQVATSNKIPTMYPASFWSQVGGLASYGPDLYSQGRQAARLAHRILTGTPPRELPVELPHKIEFVVNLKTAKSIGLPVPKSVLYRADRVIK